MSLLDSRQLSFEIPEQPFIEDTYGLAPQKIRTKFCTTCHMEKPRSDFQRIVFRSGNVGRRPRCRTCDNAAISKYEKGRGREKSRLKRKSRYDSDPDIQIIRVANLRAKKHGVKGVVTVEQWRELKQLYGNRCVYCGIENLPLHMDHLWPLAVAKKGLDISEFATHEIDNVVPACTFCNEAKKDRPFIIMLGWKNNRLQ